MLRIAVVRETQAGTALVLEGALIGAWVDELRRLCEPAVADGAGVTLDLGAVSFAGREGVALLTSLRTRGVALVNCSALVAEQLKAHADNQREPSMNTNAQLLIERLRAQDTAALETVMDQFSARVYRVAFGITRSHAEAEEVVQDVFLTLFRKVDSFEGRAALGTWLYRVAANAALGRRRGKRVGMETLLEDQLPAFTSDGHREGDRAFLIKDWSQTPEEELLSGEARAILDSALDELPEHYRAILVMRDVEELSNEEVAEVLGESVSTVKSRLHRARMALRETLTRRLQPRLDT